MNEILRSEERIIFELRKLYNNFGYQPFKMNRFEEYDLYVRNKDFLIADQVITFSDHSGKLLALKPDVTLSIIKNVQDVPGLVQKLYYNENVYRTDKDSHDFKEIMQAGLECVGDLTMFETAEVVLLAAKSLAVMDRPFVLDISHMGLLNSVLENSGLTKDCRKEALTFLHQKNVHELKALCLENGCDDSAYKLLVALATMAGASEAVLPTLEALLYTDEQKAFLDELRSICALIASQGFAGAVNIDFSAGSHMKYYSGIVFSGYLEGIPEAVLSGGQYDSLLRKMKKTSKSVGFAIYLDLLQRVLTNPKACDVDTVLLYDADETLDAVMKTAAALRQTASVLVAQDIPKNVTYAKLMKLQNGEAVTIDENS